MKTLFTYHISDPIRIKDYRSNFKRETKILKAGSLAKFDFQRTHGIEENSLQQLKIMKFSDLVKSENEAVEKIVLQEKEKPEWQVPDRTFSQVKSVFYKILYFRTRPFPIRHLIII